MTDLINLGLIDQTLMHQISAKHCLAKDSPVKHSSVLYSLVKGNSEKSP